MVIQVATKVRFRGFLESFTDTGESKDGRENGCPANTKSTVLVIQASHKGDNAAQDLLILS